eukprot:jgi/Bigna1/77623/fgenesh1_pg.49_\
MSLVAQFYSHGIQRYKFSRNRFELCPVACSKQMLMPSCTALVALLVTIVLILSMNIRVGGLQLRSPPSPHMRKRHVSLAYSNNGRPSFHKGVSPQAISSESNPSTDSISALNLRVDTEILKENLKQLLKKNDGDTATQQVTDTLKKISEIWRSKLPEATTLTEENCTGNYGVISRIEYPGCLGKDEEGYFRYTLGRTCFNIFKPSDLIVSIKNVRNPVQMLAQEEENGVQRPRGAMSYKTLLFLAVGDMNWLIFLAVIDLVIRTPDGEKMDAVLTNNAICWPSAEKGRDKDRLDVMFTGGELRPAPSTDIDLWKSIFEPAYGRKLGMIQRVKKFLLRKLLGIKSPESVKSDGSMAFEMQKSPKGYLDILYNDSEMRITKGCVCVV